MSVSETKIPVVVFDLGGTEATCGVCGKVIERDEERYVLVDPADRESLAAHLRFVDDEVDETCMRELRARWEELLGEHEAVLLTLGHVADGTRFFAGPIALHAGAALDVLLADGHWLAGRFEYQTGERPRALLYVGLGGFDPRPAPLEVPADTVVRIPPS